MALTSRMVTARRLAARAAKSGTASSALVILGTTLTELCVCFVSTASLGILPQSLVFALKITSGTETSVSSTLLAVETGSTTQFTNSAFALMATTGLDLSARSRLPAAVEKSGTQPATNATALSPSTGMEGPVCFVLTVRDGTTPQRPVIVLLEPNGATSSAR